MACVNLRLHSKLKGVKPSKRKSCLRPIGRMCFDYLTYYRHIWFKMRNSIYLLHFVRYDGNENHSYSYIISRSEAISGAHSHQIGTEKGQRVGFLGRYRYQIIITANNSCCAGEGKTSPSGCYTTPTTGLVPGTFPIWIAFKSPQINNPHVFDLGGQGGTGMVGRLLL